MRASISWAALARPGIGVSPRRRRLLGVWVFVFGGLLAGVLLGPVGSAVADGASSRLMSFAVALRAAPPAGAQGSGRLRVVVSGLPRDADGDVVVRGPRGFVRVLRSSRTFVRVRPGVYRVRVATVRFARSYSGVPAGSEAFAAKGFASVRVRGRHTAVVRAAYGTIRSSRDVVLRGAPLSVRGSRSDPRAIVLPLSAAEGLKLGMIVAQAPSASLPDGLFDQVTALSRSGGSVIVSLKPASLWDAFPALDVDTAVSLGSPAAADARLAHAANALGNLDLSFSLPLIPGRLDASCGASPSGWSFAPSGSLRPTLTVDIHRGFLGLPYGQLSLTLAGNVGFDATIPKGTHCDITVDGPHPVTLVFIAGVPVPVEGKLDLDLSIATSGPVQAHASAGITIAGGVNLRGTYGTPILSVKQSANGWVHANGATLTLGPVMQVGLGLGLDVSNDNVHIQDALDVAAKISPSTPCEIDFGGSAGVGIDLGPLAASYSPFSPEVPVYHCPKTGTGPTGPTGPTGGGNPSVSVTNPGSQTGTVGTLVSLRIQASDTDGGTLSYSATGLPAGLSISSSTGQITGSPTTAGSTYATVTATDATGPSGKASFNWTINPGGSGSGVAAGGSQTCALLSGGQIDCWGDNSYGELGNGTTTTSDVPVPVSGITNATQVAASDFAFDTCAVLVGGVVDCWGDNTYGELGDGTTTGPDCSGTCSTTPLAVSRINNATAIAVGGQYTCALLSTGGVDCWGWNGYGELGSGTNGGPSCNGECIPTPVAVSGITNATAIAAGGDHTCALLSTGGVDCWGVDAYGELGSGNSNMDSSTPVPVTGITNATAITAGYYHTCAVLAAGGVDCWGWNYRGQLGNGTTTDSSTPVPVSGITNATTVAAGHSQTCALLSGGQIDCWGDNNYGELGNGTTTTSDLPVAVSGTTNATTVAAGGSQTCALLSGGQIDCWGDNDYGELGNGATTYSDVPVAVSGIP